MKKIAFLLSFVLVMTGVLSLDTANVSAKSTEFEYLLFESDFENHNLYNRPNTSTGDMTKWTQDGNVSTPYQVSIAEDDGNKVLKLKRNSDTSPDAPCIIKRLIVDNNTKINIKFKIKTCGQYFELQLYTFNDADARVVTKTAILNGEDVVSPGPLTGKLSPDEYFEVDVMVDFYNRICTTYINGLQYKESTSFKDGTDFTKGYYVRFNAKPQPGEAVYLDDVCITTDNASLIGAKMFELDSIDYESDDDVIKLLKKSHPRIYFDNFDAIKNKIESDFICEAWYDSLKSAADTYLTSKPEEFIENSSKALSGARRVRYKLHILGFVYAMTGDARYLDRAMEEMRYVGKYPNWGSYLASAEMSNGYAVAYDWMYNGMTDEQREEICNIMIEKGLYIAAMSYEGISDSYFVKTESNQNMACNGCYMTVGIAFADEFPELCEYILNKAAASLPAGAGIMAPLGASPEGYQYWDYSMSNLFQAQAAMESALKPDTELPDKFDFADSPGIASAIDYYIALRSTYGAFNYGDADVGTPGWAEFSFSYWAAEKFNKGEYAWYEYNRCDLQGVYGPIWRLTHKLAYYNPQTVPGIKSDFPLDKAFVSEDATNVATMRSSWADENEIYVGIQGGSGGFTHMFQSLGTFVIDANGERWATMRGRGDYTWPGYFDIKNQKWEYYTARTEGQNCVVINPDKGPGQNTDAVAKITAFESFPQESYATLDLTQAYEEDVESYLRGVRLFDNRSKIIIQDDIKAKSAIKEGYWFMHTDADVKIFDSGKEAILFKNGKRLYAKIVSGHDGAKFSYVDAKPLPQSPDPEIQQDVDYGRKLSIDISGEEDICLAIMFVALGDKSAPSEYEADVTPVAEWSASDDTSISSELAGGVALFANSPYAYRNDEKTYIDSAQKNNVTTIIKDGRALIPVRFVAEALGALVSWDESENATHVSIGEKKVKIPVGKNHIFVNETKIPIDVSSAIVNSRTYIPLRAVSEALGYDVYWDDSGVIAVGVSSLSEGVIKNLAGLIGHTLMIDGEEVFDAILTSGKQNFYSDFENGECTVGIRYYYPECKTKELSLASPDQSAVFEICDFDAQIVITDDEYRYYGGSKAIRDMWITSDEIKDKRHLVTWLEPINISATQEQTPIENICDNNINTLWTSQGANYVEYDFGETKSLYSVALAIDSRGTRKYSFKIQASDNGNEWHDILPDTYTSIYTNLPEIFYLGDVRARYVRLVANGNTANDYNNFYEMRFYESAAQEAEDLSNWNDYFGKVNWTELKVGDCFKLDTRAYCMDGSCADLSGGQVTYKSSDSSVVSVNSAGELVCNGAGDARITASVSYHGIIKEVTQTLTVTTEEGEG